MAEVRNDKSKAIEVALLQIEKQFGKGSIMRLGDKEAVSIPTISTGALSIDAALGIGGVPRGRVVEIFRTRIVWQNDSGFACNRRSAKSRRHGCIY